jgi:hypothetical protein
METSIQICSPYRLSYFNVRREMIITCPGEARKFRVTADTCSLLPRNHHPDTLAQRTMRWPGSGTDDDKKKRDFELRIEPLQSADWRTTLTDPRSVLPAVAAAITSVAAVRLYKTYLRRIPSVDHIKPHYFRQKGVFGRVTSVGDADNFRLYHTPGGRIAGWGWLPWKRVPTKRGDLTDQTVSCQISNLRAQPGAFVFIDTT